ncbi:autotransporter outer membrane beta-barrel domain-containing protein [Mesorhizobium xinjiangense]|uniref:autotransporter outer membrane beta-barrel domain-containing protein n=1 Tax=Mesorhizobium xinjiangense TaxID=2678685 RepID=UPI0012ED2C0C|nr:autotransporter outer membrane beta-barrel domain-containing protein [Mesorhizobium xinjiangense]
MDWNSCTVPSGEGTTGVSVVDTGTNVDDQPYTLTNDADITASTANQSVILHLELDGSAGNDDGDTGDATAHSGGALTLTNNGDIMLQGGGGNWGHVNGIFVQANGGAGARPGHNGDDGGRGGDSGTINLTNNGTITIDASAGSSRPTVTGIYAGASAGAGGDMNSGAGDQKGGNSGDAKTVTVVNNGEIHIGAEGNAFTGDGGGHAIYAFGDGSNGGSENGEGGAGGTISVTNNAAISLYWNGWDSAPQGVHGIYARSQGGNGIVSGDNSDPGGKGESARPITLTTNGDITIESSGGTPTGPSAAMYAISQGGDGGAGPDKDHDGGAGGGASINADGSEGYTTLTVQNAAAISASGAGIMGVAARSLGGNGGDGSDGTSGGAGGYGGRIQINLMEGATITTGGEEGYAILGQSVGGIGGSNASTAGAGGDGSKVGVYASSGTTITTQGDHAAGVTLHSIGGGGGVGGDFTDVLAGDGGNGGNGGDAGLVEITSGADVTTHGQYAYGLLVQSIGGSGGVGGVGEGIILALGGQGGEGGGGEDAIVNNTGAVTTTGYGANGIVAQTLSGGGGAAGAAGGAISVGGNAGAGANNSATAYVTNNNDVTTTGDAAVGILVQSIGGGGGVGAGAAGVAAVGGSGGAGGSAGVARIFHVGGIVSTAGEFSHGLVAQSIGGGGGSGGNVVDVSVGAGLGIGGSGSGGGYGGHACVSNTYDGCDYTDSGNQVDGSPSDDGSQVPAPSQPGSTIITSGDFSVGAMAQSIGGGGGNGGTANGAGALDVATLQIGGSGGAGSDGRPALMTFDNLTLTTQGSNAPGLLTQSIGGGGGNGGSAKSADVEDILPVQVGGTGGSGGAGVEATTVLSGGRLTTTGTHSSAVVAQSIGGGGGNGGSAAGYSASVGLGINTSVGASGGSGGSGGTVSVNVASTTISTGIDENGNVIDGVTDSHGVVAQSIGGGGGNGGTSVADAMTVAFPGAEVDLPPFAASITTSVGGKGGVAGAGGTVAATLTGSTHVQTGGDGSIGVLAQSIAHGGGNGGSASSLSGTIGDLDTVSSDISTAVGNAGGAGGNTGAASVALNDTVWVHTAGDHSNAVVVQSIGGGGGNGGVGSASNDQIGGGFNLSANIGLGGKGGSGGAPGSATVHFEDGTSITTTGSGSRGVLAQSIGGGGGTGQGGTIGLSGSASVGGGEGEEAAEGEDEGPISGSVNVNIGSETGDGMTGGTVSVTANGSISTTGGDADGILAQSIGGSGGLAGSVGNDAGSDSDGFAGGDEDTNYTLTASLGGRGGTGGHGGDVDVTIDNGHVTTTGDWADSVVAQSIGGGGGAGGTSTAAGSDATASIDLAIGGHGGAGGDGGAVNATFVDTYGSDDYYLVSTSGFAAYGVLLQSIGGGGGQGGDGSDSASGGITVGGGIGGSAGSSGDGKAVTITSGSALSVLTQGHDAHAVVAQSIGGGGGIGGAGNSEAATDDDSHSIDLSVGGSGGSSGSGGTVKLDVVAPWSGIQTKGDRSYGVLAQSIGGGGGLGGGGSSDSVASLTVGGSGGAAGDGEAVTLSMSGIIHTTGIDAHGIVAQSIGGGGGIGGAGTVTTNTPLKFGGQDGASGDGGDVALHLSGLSVTTEGNGAHAVIAQSIGGGGGIAGNTGGSVDAANYYTGADSSGSGHAVSVNIDNNITTHGDRAHGIVAQSIGGGGGIYNTWGGGETIYGSTASGYDGISTSGDVTFSQAGTLTTNGAGSIGIFAQSTSLSGGNSDFLGTITGTVNGRVTGGTGDGAAAIYMIDGKNNTLTVSETGSVAAGDSDAWSIYYFGYTVADYSKLDVTIDEGGTVYDNIYLSAGTVYNNSHSSLIGASLYVADIVNNGRLVVGDSGSRDKTRITRDLTQTDAGFVQVGVDFDARRSGRLIVEGDADLAGGVHLDTETLVRNVELGVLNVEGNLTGGIDAIDSPAVDFSARTVDKEIRVKAIDSRFANAFDMLSDNQREAGRHLDAIFDRDSGRYARLLGGINMLSWEEDGGASYAAALSSLSPGGSQAAAAAQATLAAGRLDGALRCPTFSGEATRRNEESCFWADAGGAAIEQDGLPGYDGTVWGLGTGGQVEFGDNWFAGGAIGYEDSQFDGTDGLTSADGGTGYLAVALGRRFGDFTLSAALAGSYGSFDTTRSLFLPDFSGTAEGNTDVTTLSARLRAAYTMGTERAYLRPSVDLDVVYTHASGYTESGAGIYNLDVFSQEQTALIATPAVEIGGSRPLTDGWNMGGFASAGVSFSSEDAWETDATLTAAPDGAGTFSTTLPIADVVAKLRAGISFTNEDNDLEVKLEYDGAFGDDYSSHGGLLRLSKRF